MAHQPQNLVVTPVSTTEIDLSWDDVGTLEDETFDIERNSVIVEASYAGSHSIAAPYTDTGLDPDSEYTYRVRAVGGIIPAPVTPPAAPVAARVSIFTPVITISASADVTPTTVSVVAVVFASDIAATISTVTPATVVASVSVEVPTISGESYSDSYGLPYGGTGGADADLTPSTVVTASTVLTPVIAIVDAPALISGLVAWFDFSDISTLWQDAARTTAITTDAQVIKGVTDKSGNGTHLSEATNGPAYKTNIQNSRSASLWDGSNDILSGTITQAQPFTLFAVLNCTETAASQKQIFIDTSGGLPLWQIRPELPSPGQSMSRIYAGTLVDGTATFRNVFKIGMVIFNGASSIGYASGGTADLSGNPGATGFSAAFSISHATGAFKGYFCEMGMYSGALSVADRNLLGSYLATKWGVTWSTVS